jgi:hypothetical protein
MHNLQNKFYRLNTTIESVKWLATQACAFRGDYKSIEPSTHGNFLEMIEYSSTLNEENFEIFIGNSSRKC